MKKIFLFFALGFLVKAGYTNEGDKNLDAVSVEPPAVQDTSENERNQSKLFNFDVLFRGALLGDNLGKDDAVTRAKMEEIRLHLHGNYNDDLSYKVRLRLNRPFAPNSLDNGSGALDFALIEYKFGKNRNWDVTVGKQSAMVGSYEFENNPIYEFMFTDYVDRILNLFVTGAKLGYHINPNHSFHVQVHNTVNNNFNEHILNNGFAIGDLQRSKVPMGAYFTWVGAFADQKIHTKWSYHVSQFADKHTNHAISLANKYKTDKQMVYLDLQYSHMGVDHALIASNGINDFYDHTGAGRVLAKDIVYKTAVLRYDQFLTDKWEIALKGAVEAAGSTKDEELGKDFRQNYTYFAALQHKPFRNQDMRFYLGYIGNSISYADKMNVDRQQLNRLALGAYFTIPLL
ncbi:porin [Sphingobacterium chuzhouense]|uniref:Phosphate-selective porin O and P n=1 Tax=Sphingobacterium chuzhouense TaxID=1742264 RepID=A0ABR7XTF0_9SPHI|nr:porin [Sphingobacterium chuzhouense]MBD1422433.1 hypothetical protein [Sphingobacterium chuzhouense]